MQKTLIQFDDEFWAKYPVVAGFDEAGRGAWAGPVVAAAVIFDEPCDLPGLNDSKKLTPKKRDILFDEIIEKALSYGIGVISSVDVDRFNILEATKMAMGKALQQLTPKPNHCLVDGHMNLLSGIDQTPIINGDSLSFSIAAASILAKVTRDRMMMDEGEKFPGYGFEKHKGYGTKIHREALQDLGICPIHRKTYKPVAELLYR